MFSGNAYVFWHVTDPVFNTPLPHRNDDYPMAAYCPQSSDQRGVSSDELGWEIRENSKPTMQEIFWPAQLKTSGTLKEDIFPYVR